jgi:putative restriction endonuclease
MPAMKARPLTDVLMRALEDAGFSVDLLSAPNANPRKLLVHGAEETLVVWAHVWTLTFGGRRTLPDEYRVQMTGVRSPLPLNDKGPTVLLGYEPSLQMFAGFDVLRHSTFTPGSPSVQIDIKVVRKAITDGLSFERKGNQEVVCGIRPDQMLTYITTASEIHQHGKSAATYRVLSESVTGEKLSRRALLGLSAPRQQVIQEISRLSRAAQFRRVVLQAYDQRCAVTGIQLRLVDAAHILPVGAPGSTDEISNAIALAPTYHRAFDRGLIFVDERYYARLNRTKAQELV